MVWCCGEECSLHLAAVCRYCAFGDYDKETADAEQLVQNRMPYVQWLVEHVAAQLTPDEVKLRRQHGKASGLVEAARRDAEEWARQVPLHPKLTLNLHHNPKP